MIYAFILFVFLTVLFFDNHRLSFEFSHYNDVFFKFKKSFSLKDIKIGFTLNAWPALAALVKGGGGAAAAKGGAASGGGGMMGKMGGMMGGKGGGGGGGNGMSTLVNGATKPMKATMGLATGGIQAIQAARLKKKADAAFPELVDPNQASYLSELNQKRRSIETGADFSEAVRAADASQATASDSITSSGGGDVGGTMQALLQSQRVSSDAKNNAIAQGQGQQFNYDSAYGNQMNQMAARRLQLQLMRSQQARAEWDRKSKLASANLQAGAAGLVPGGNSNPQPAMQLGGGDGSSAPTNFPSDWNFKGAAPATVPVNPNPTPATSIETTGVQSPKVVPQATETTKSLGPVMNLLKK